MIFKIAGVAQLVERQPSKLNVAGSNPVSRSKSDEISYNGNVISSFNKGCRFNTLRRRSSGVERFLGKEEVTSSNLVIGSKKILYTNIN